MSYLSYNDYDEMMIGQPKPKTFKVGDIVSFNGDQNGIFLIESVRIDVAMITYKGIWLQHDSNTDLPSEIYDWIGDSQWTKINERKK